MAALVTVQQASSNALTAWLQSQAPVDWFIDSRWPDPDRVLPAKAVTIITAGPVTWDMIDPVLVAGPLVNPNTSQPPLFTWMMRLGIQPLQLDVWANTDIARDDMLARMEPMLNAGNAATGVSTNDDPFRHGVLLNMGDGWLGTTDVVFIEPEVTDDPQSVSRSEFRATYRGESHFNLFMTAPTVAIAHIRLSMQINELPTISSSQPYDRFTQPSIHVGPGNSGPEADEDSNSTP